MVGAAAGGNGVLTSDHHQAQAGVVPAQAGVVPVQQQGIASGHHEGIVPVHQTQAPLAGEGVATGPTGAMREQSVVGSSHPVMAEERRL